MKKLPLIAGIAAMVIFLLLYPDNCLKSARFALALWLGTVLPSLFPFVLASFMLLETGLIRLIAHFFAPVTRFLFNAPGESAYIFITSALSGYPVGARLAAELYQTGRMSEADAQAVVRFTSVSGPVFITGAVSAGMLGLHEAGVYLAVTHYLAALLTGIIFGLFRRRKAMKAPGAKISFREALSRFRRDAAQCPPVGELMADGVEKAMSMMLRIGGYIILFSVIMEMLSVTGILGVITKIYSPLAGLMGISEQGVSAMILGSLEATTGCAKTAAMAAPLSLTLPIIASIIAFGGFCVHMQTHAVCAAARLKPKGFGLAKMLHGTLASMLCALALKLFPLAAAASSISAASKNAAYGGVIFAAVSLLSVFLIRLFRRRRKSILPLG
jgi:hypothetical protein